LVEVAPNSKPPVAKIMDYGKFKYEEAQKAKEARRNQANTILKEVRFRLKIDVHDYETKRKRAEGFLAAGDKVKAMILFRGREQSRPDQGVRLLQRFAEDVSEFGSVESSPTIDGRNMVMVIGPHKTKATAKAEAHAKQATARPARTEGAAPEQAPATPVAAKPVEEVPAFVKKAPVAEKPVVEKAAPVAEKPAVEKAAAPVAEKPVAAKAPEKPAAAPRAAAAPKATPAAAPKAAPVTRQATPANAPKPSGAAKPAPSAPKPPAAPKASASKPVPAPKPAD
jgi:translation initiation factor IF-3